MQTIKVKPREEPNYDQYIQTLKEVPCATAEQRDVLNKIIRHFEVSKVIQENMRQLAKRL